MYLVSLLSLLLITYYYIHIIIIEVLVHKYVQYVHTVQHHTQNICMYVVNHLFIIIPESTCQKSRTL